MGFHNSKLDNSPFLKGDANSLVRVPVYVNEIIITSSYLSLVNDLISNLHLQFTLKNLRILHYFLVVQVSYMEGSLCLSQQKTRS